MKSIVDLYENFETLVSCKKNVKKVESLGLLNFFYIDRKSTRLNSSHESVSRMPSSA